MEHMSLLLQGMDVCFVAWRTSFRQLLRGGLTQLPANCGRRFRVPEEDCLQLTMNRRGRCPPECAEQISAALWRNMDSAPSTGAAEGSGMGQ